MRIHIKNQALFSSKYKCKKIKMSSAAMSFGALRVTVNIDTFMVRNTANSIFASSLRGQF